MPISVSKLEKKERVLDGSLTIKGRISRRLEKQKFEEEGFSLQGLRP